MLGLVSFACTCFRVVDYARRVRVVIHSVVLLLTCEFYEFVPTMPVASAALHDPDGATEILGP